MPIPGTPPSLITPPVGLPLPSALPLRPARPLADRPAARALPGEPEHFVACLLEPELARAPVGDRLARRPRPRRRGRRGARAPGRERPLAGQRRAGRRGAGRRDAARAAAGARSCRYATSSSTSRSRGASSSSARSVPSRRSTASSSRFSRGETLGHRGRDGLRQEHDRAADHAPARRHLGESSSRARTSPP